jgi:hypothetical protein
MQAPVGQQAHRPSCHRTLPCSSLPPLPSGVARFWLLRVRWGVRLSANRLHAVSGCRPADSGARAPAGALARWRRCSSGEQRGAALAVGGGGFRCRRLCCHQSTRSGRCRWLWRSWRSRGAWRCWGAFHPGGQRGRPPSSGARHCCRRDQEGLEVWNSRPDQKSLPARAPGSSAVLSSRTTQEKNTHEQWVRALLWFELARAGRHARSPAEPPVCSAHLRGARPRRTRRIPWRAATARQHWSVC